ncbi:MAG: PAS domain-containing protein [Gemmatimonadales bacterium]|nr:PAS domain-containing protein [Gemmatimonadales bacterium]
MDQQEYLLRRSEIVSQGVEENPSAILVVGPGGRILLASDGAGVLFGMARAEMVGRQLEAFMVSAPGRNDLWKPDSCESGVVHNLEIRNSQGELIPVEAQCFSFSTRSISLGGEDQEDQEDQSHWMVMMTDTRLREHEDELRAARLAKLSLLNQVSDALHGADLTLDQILQAVLICMTAGQGLRFNRAFLLLIDHKQEILQGEIAIGPSNADEASRIWMDLAEQPGDLLQMMTCYDRSIKQTDVAVNEIVRHMTVPLSDENNLLVQVMHERGTKRLTAEMTWPGAETLRFWLGCSEFAVAPLVTRQGPLGVIVADNAISRTPITDLDLEFLLIFANQSAAAIENSRLYHELEQRLQDLGKAHQKQKEDQESLMRMERLSVMGETSAIVAHELRNPLVAIGGFARTLMRSLNTEDPNREYARIITEEVSRMEGIIHDLLDFIRPRKQTRKMLVLDELVAGTMGRFQGELDQKGLSLNYCLQAGSVEVSCNPGEIQQVLQNFLVNAMQMLLPGGGIEVRTSQLEGGVKVEVLDNGPGFAEDVADKLFSPFFSTKATGSGLGLTISAQIIKAHGGVPGARNRDSGGANFFFILPLPKREDGE